VCGTLYLAKRSFIASSTQSCMRFSGCFACISRNEDRASIGSQPLTITLPCRVVSLRAGVSARLLVMGGAVAVPLACCLSAAAKLLGFGLLILFTCVVV